MGSAPFIMKMSALLLLAALLQDERHYWSHLPECLPHTQAVQPAQDVGVGELIGAHQTKSGIQQSWNR
jgi:hypothetical protein